jgi:16S rRNA (uracil1498-N3)-methyltransferase
LGKQVTRSEKDDIMHIFFEEKIHSEFVILSREESQHCARVLRLRAGEEIMITDGRGNCCVARLTGVNPDNTMAAVISRDFVEKRPFNLHMAVAPTKNIDRFEWFLEKATECGIEEITPVICENSERTVVKTERLQKIIMAAMKQSKQYWLPRLNEPVKFNAFLKNDIPTGTPAFMAHCAEGSKQTLIDACKPDSDVVILIGPEGDFSPKEIKMAHEMSLGAISLGENRLRTETAALAACMVVNFINRRLG